MRRALVWLALMCVPAYGHSWYDYDCCSDNDCAPLADGAVIEGSGGYDVTMNGKRYAVPYGDARIRASADNQFHACEYPKDTLRCLYTPGRAF